MIRETTLPADPIRLARALADRPGLALLASSPHDAASFVGCEPTHASDELVPEPQTSSGGWAGRPAAPRWVGAIPYEHFRGLERARWTSADLRAPPMISSPRWLHYAAMLRIDHATGIVSVESDDADRGERLVSLARRPPRAAATVSLTLMPEADDEPAHAGRITAALALIAAGDLYQVNLARRLAFAMVGSPLDLFAEMWRRSPARYGLMLDLGGVHIVGASPELALEVRGDRLRTSPIKGTRPRGTEASGDAWLKRELDDDPKERAELVMAVDLHRNDLGKIARAGSVRVLGRPSVVSGRTVHSRGAEVVALREAGVTLSRVAEACLPSGSVTGAPKVRAMEIIRDLEAHRRGLYTGAMGYVGRDGSLVLAMAIRTATVADGVAHYGSGGGIVWGSDPAREVEETRWKAVQMGAFAPAGGGSMR